MKRVITMRFALWKSFGLSGPLALLLGCLHALPAAAAMYSVTDLGTLGGSYSYAYGINASGQVVGYSTTSSGNHHAFLYSGGAMTDLGTLGGADSFAHGINDAGQVVGYSYTDTDVMGKSISRAFLNTGGTMINLGTLIGDTSSRANGINSSGQVVGDYSSLNIKGSVAFLYSSSDGSIADLGTLGGTNSRANGINNGGQVVGSSSTGTATHAFLYTGGTMTDLGTLGGTISGAYGINDSGQVVGSSNTSASGDSHAFLYSGGTMTDLGTLGGAYSEARAINTTGQIVGNSNTTGDTATHGFLYSGGTMTDLNSLVGPGWTIEDAYGINDAGQIAANGYNSQGEYRALLLTPTAIAVPEPGTFLAWSSFALLGVATAALRRRRSPAS